MSKDKRERLDIYEGEYGNYEIYADDQSLPKCRLRVWKEDGAVVLHVHVDGVTSFVGPALSVVPEVSNCIRVVMR